MRNIPSINLRQNLGIHHSARPSVTRRLVHNTDRPFRQVNGHPPRLGMGLCHRKLETLPPRLRIQARRCFEEATQLVAFASRLCSFWGPPMSMVSNYRGLGVLAADAHRGTSWDRGTDFCGYSVWIATHRLDQNSEKTVRFARRRAIARIGPRQAGARIRYHLPRCCSAKLTEN